MPALGLVSASDVICSECFTPDVQNLLNAMSLDDIEKHFDCFDQLKLKIGYSAMCTECLYENAGLDLRRLPLK
jgi:hypothetical protein